jgi:hypothetical protein
MLNRDKNILESLSKKYGKRYILNEVKKSDKEWDMEVYTTYGGIQYATEKTPEGWNFTVDGYDGGRRWRTKPNMEKVVGTRIKRIDRYKWSDDGDDYHEVIYPNRDPNYIGGVGKNNHRAIRESLRYKTHNKINESISTKDTEYIGGKFLIDETDFNNLPMFSQVKVGNVGWEELNQEYGYSPSMTFEKVDRDVWKLVSVFIPGPIGKPNRPAVNVSDGIEVSIREILKHNVYKVSGKTYEYNDIYVAIPLHRPDGDMNVLYMYKGSDIFKYDDRVTLIKLLKSHDKNNDALFKFSTIREDDTILVNICHDNGSKYYLKCNVDELDEILKTHSKRVFRNNFNTYW